MSHVISKLISATIVAKALVLLSGCATTSYQVRVDAVRSEQSVGEEKFSYRLVNANPESPNDDLRVQQAWAQVTTALSSKGLYEAPAGTAAEFVVEVDFGIEAPRQVVEQRKVVARPNRDDPFSTSLVEDGEKTITVVVTVHEKFVRITAREAPERCGDRAPRELWSVFASTVDESDDLDRYVAILIAAAMDEITSDTGRPQETTVTRDDARVVFVRRGM